MIRHERIGDTELQEVDLSGVDKIIELAKLAQNSPNDLRAVLVETIHQINKPALIIGVEK